MTDILTRLMVDHAEGADSGGMAQGARRGRDRRGAATGGEALCRLDGRPWPVVVAILEQYDTVLAADVASCCNPGKGRNRDMVTGQFTGHDNVMTGEPAAQGNSRAYTLNRLKRVAPELFEKVKAQQMTANAAARMQRDALAARAAA